MPIEPMLEGQAGRAGFTGLAGLLAALAGVYVTQTLTTTLAMQSLPVLLRQAGASLELVGLSALFMLPWALRFLWAPAVERWRLPVGTAQRRSRRLILHGQWLLAACFMVAAVAGALDGLSLVRHAYWLLGLFFLAALLSATVDIACGGFAVDQLSEAQRGLGTTAKVGGSYVGMLLGNSVFLLLAARLDWPLALACMGALIVLTGWPLLRFREPDRARAGTVAERPGLLRAWRRPQVRLGLLLAFALGAGVRVAMGMLGPLLLDKGASLEHLAWLLGGFSVGAGLLGTVLGGALVRWAGGWRAIGATLVLQALALLALAAGEDVLPLGPLALVAGAFFVTMACGFVAIYAALMGLASPSQPGVDFALFQCADALMAMAGGVAGGWLAQRWGYSVCFGLAAALALLALALLSVCRQVGPAAEGGAP